MTEAAREFVRLQRDDGIAVLTLDYAERRNAYSLGMKQQLLAHLNALMDDRGCAAIVLTGAGGHFCAGGDISQMQARDLVGMRQALGLTHNVVRTMVNGPKPMVAAVEGYAYGVGMSLAIACDHVVAASDSRFCCAFARIGLAPDGGLRWSLSQRVGPAKARELAMLATELDGAEAARIGVANEVVEPGAALARAIAVARLYAAKPPVTLALIKASFARGGDTLDDVLRNEVDYQPVLKTTADHKEAVKAFLEKRKPTFTGS